MAEYTPKGYRIDPAEQHKYLLLSQGQEIAAEATEAEMELWQINRELVKVLRAVLARGCGCRVNNLPGWHSEQCLIPQVEMALRDTQAIPDR